MLGVLGQPDRQPDSPQYGRAATHSTEQRARERVFVRDKLSVLSSAQNGSRSASYFAFGGGTCVYLSYLVKAEI